MEGGGTSEERPCLAVRYADIFVTRARLFLVSPHRQGELTRTHLFLHVTLRSTGNSHSVSLFSSWQGVLGKQESFSLALAGAGRWRCL